jgi:hypothetical protein
VPCLPLLHDLQWKEMQHQVQKIQQTFLRLYQFIELTNNEAILVYYPFFLNKFVIAKTKSVAVARGWNDPVNLTPITSGKTMDIYDVIHYHQSI